MTPDGISLEDDEAFTDAEHAEALRRYQEICQLTGETMSYPRLVLMLLRAHVAQLKSQEWRQALPYRPEVLS